MSKLKCDISISADGFVAGPNQSHENPLGEGGERLHDWVVSLAVWREAHGYEGGEINAFPQRGREQRVRAGQRIEAARESCPEGLRLVGLSERLRRDRLDDGKSILHAMIELVDEEVFLPFGLLAFGDVDEDSDASSYFAADVEKR